MTEQPKIYRLVMVSGPEPGRRYVVRQSSALLGRDPKCRIRVDADGVADQQLAIRLHGEDAVLTVLDHAKPVSIRGEPVTERRLEQGDVLAMGAVQLEFQWVEPLPFYATRRRGLVERGAIAAVWGVIAAQVLLLAALAWIWVGRGGSGILDADGPMGATPTGPGAEERWEGRELTRISRDVDALRGWVDEVAGQVESVASIPEADVPATPEGATPEPADTVAASQQLLSEAREQIAAGDWRAAEILLDRAQQADPTQDGVYVTRARLYQQQGDYASALGQWELAVSHAGSAAALQEANTERTRLEGLIRRREADRIARDARARAEVDARARAEAEARVGEGTGSREQPAEGDARVPASADIDRQSQPEDAAAASRRIRIDNVRRERFRNRENYEEIRLVRFDLAPRKSGPDEVRADAVRVEVEFYDRDVDSGEITQSRAPSPSNGLALTPDWPPEQVQTLSALYMVPRDFRRTESQTLGVRRQYYGFVIRVYYQDDLQDEEAFPVTLLERARQAP
jgi:tetratricopeptide (TPR) repeat protein